MSTYERDDETRRADIRRAWWYSCRAARKRQRAAERMLRKAVISGVTLFVTLAVFIALA